jgi:hypothetical protein
MIDGNPSISGGFRDLAGMLENFILPPLHGFTEIKQLLQG